MVRRTVFGLAVILAVGVIVHSCVTTHNFRSNYEEANAVMHASQNLYVKPFLKAHHKNGDISILKNTWNIDTVQSIVTGSGTRYDFNRRQVYEGDLSIYIDSIALFETNTKLNKESGRIAALAILGALNISVGAFCLLNPKACFGSCPTFYTSNEENLHYADAEGFSNAIIPSLEYADIDALDNRKVSNGRFSITMKNEALETHCVKEVKLLAYPTKPGERVYQSPADQFYLCKDIYSLSSAKAYEGDVKALLSKEDKQERFSLSDENNLNSKEEIYLQFDNVKAAKQLGLVMHYRQTLMTTYLFYSSMDYMGDKVSDVFALLETDEGLRNRFDTTTRILGKIDVYVWNEELNDWALSGGLYETGPIAINKHIVPLKGVVPNAEVKIKLVFNKGLWRIDYVALTQIAEEVEPLEIRPSEILNGGKADELALSQLNSPEDYLISMPGNEYKLQFTLPSPGLDYELFLYSKGYYLEWMRAEWLKEKDMEKLQQMVYNPHKYLRNEAKSYKLYEADMEEKFWKSRIQTKSFSSNEN